MIEWRPCAKCGKSFDGIYRQYFGCRACRSVEPLDAPLSDLTGPPQKIPKKRHPVRVAFTHRSGGVRVRAVA